ncbi:hypothetical protein HAX54_050174 [Datura stramonium]|uniref:TPX2 C-terminal domain-containing protein n=1 Tax=Datura stramonium TaxID=4076 RepID=A0ABS8SXP8_DATST|nr:hypothetical protein [Datura stramonium]
MESPNTKSSQKVVKSNSQSPIQSPGRVMRSSSPQHQLMKNNNLMATKFYFIEQQKKTVEKVQKMIEEEEVRMLRKEMIPRAQLMPFFDKPFLPQRSTRPLTIPKEPSFMLNGKCSSCMNFSIFSTMKQVK